LNDQIGKGFSSKVYRGKNDKTSEPVAIKVAYILIYMTMLGYRKIIT